ncbi:MAG TPA: hypothetical protein PLF91_05605 [Mycolicibacterium fallax]|nr:hypothetical protein [Mycolicibacterium fallax]
MVDFKDRTPRTGSAMPPAAGGSVNGIRLLMAIMFVLIAVAALTGVVVATLSGQPTVAIIIGLVAAAFFCGAVC